MYTILVDHYFHLSMTIKKGIHHIRHSRPKWYKEYHQWEHHAVLHWVTFIVSSIVIMMGFFNTVSQMLKTPTVDKAHAATASTTLTQDVTAGVLSISNTGTQALSSTAVSISNQNTTGSLGTITVTDNRGTGVGWSATATSTHFIKYNSPTTTGGSNNTLSVHSSATYNNATQGTYTVTITSGGSSGVAQFSISGLETATGLTTGAAVSAGTRGLVLSFAAATYTTSDSWTIRVDVLPVTGLQLTPGSLTTISGSSTNVTAGSVHTFSSTSDATSLISASTGYGLGSYSVTPSLQLTVPANSYANSYTATVVETVL